MPITRLTSPTERVWAYDIGTATSMLPILTFYGATTGSGTSPAVNPSVTYPIVNQVGTTNPGLYFAMSYAAVPTYAQNSAIVFGGYYDSYMSAGFVATYFTGLRVPPIHRRAGQTVTCTFVVRMPRCASVTLADTISLRYGLVGVAGSTGNVTANTRIWSGGNNHTTGNPGFFSMQDAPLNGAGATGNVYTVQGDAEYPGSIIIDGTGNVTTTIAGTTTTSTLTGIVSMPASFHLAVSHASISSYANIGGVRNVRITVT